MGKLVVAGHQICANRPKRAFFGPKSAVLRKCLRIFLPTFGFQNRAFAHFFWAFFVKIVRTRFKISSKSGSAHFPPFKSGLKFTRFQRAYGRSSLPPNPTGLLINQHNPPFDLKPSQLANIKDSIEQFMKPFVFFGLYVSQRFISSRVEISFSVFSGFS